MGFVKFEEDVSVRKKIVIYPDSAVKIVVDGKVSPYSKFIRLKDFNEFYDLLNVVDKEEK